MSKRRISAEELSVKEPAWAAGITTLCNDNNDLHTHRFSYQVQVKYYKSQHLKILTSYLRPASKTTH